MCAGFRDRGGRAASFHALEVGVGSQALRGSHVLSFISGPQYWCGAPLLHLLCHLCWVFQVLGKVCSSAVKALPFPVVHLIIHVGVSQRLGFSFSLFALISYLAALLNCLPA